MPIYELEDVPNEVLRAAAQLPEHGGRPKIRMMSNGRWGIYVPARGRSRALAIWFKENGDIERTYDSDKEN